MVKKRKLTSQLAVIKCSLTTLREWTTASVSILVDGIGRHLESPDERSLRTRHEQSSLNCSLSIFHSPRDSTWREETSGSNCSSYLSLGLFVLIFQV